MKSKLDPCLEPVRKLANFSSNFIQKEISNMFVTSNMCKYVDYHEFDPKPHYKVTKRDLLSGRARCNSRHSVC
jgi:hypothetical protein